MNSTETRTIRVVVTGHDEAGRSIIAQAGELEQQRASFTPGFAKATVWATAKAFRIPDDDHAFRASLNSDHPAPGESRLMIVTFPPDSVYLSDEFSPTAAGEEMLALVPGIADRFEPDDPGMHSTDSLDYDIVLSGEIWLEVDGRKSERLVAGDVVIQNGTRHAWRNLSNEPATMAFILLGAEKRPAGTPNP